MAIKAGGKDKKTFIAGIEFDIDSSVLSKEIQGKIGGAIKQSSQALQKQLDKAIRLKVDKKDIDHLVRTHQNATEQIALYSLKLEKARAVLAKGANDAEHKKRLEAAKKEYNDKIEDLKKEQKEAALQIQKTVKAEGMLLAALGAKFHKVSKSIESDMGGIAGTFSNLMAGSVDSFAGSMTSTLAGIGNKLEQLSEKIEKKGLFKSLTSGASGLLLGLGAVAGGIFALGKAVLDVDDKTKQFNRDLLDAGTSASDLGAKGRDLSTKLVTIRKAFMDEDFNAEWGTLAEDHYKIINAFNASGMAIGEFTRGIKDAAAETKKYQEISASALTTAKLMGISGEEAAQSMAGYMEDLHISLVDVNEQMVLVGKYAKESGFSYKRFYSMILQANSGITMYNVRLSESAEMLTKLTKLLGTKAGAQFNEELSKGFKDKSWEERVKAVELAGQGTTNTILRKDVQGKADDISASVAKMQVEKTGGKEGEMAGLADELAKKGVKLDFKDPKKLAEQMSKLSVKDRTKTIGLLRDLVAEKKMGKQGDELVIAVTNLVDEARTIGKGVDVQADGLQHLGPGGALAMETAMVEGKFGDLLKLQGVQLEGVSRATGLSREHLKQLQRIKEAASWNFDAAKALAKKYDTAEKRNTRAFREENQAMGKLRGIMVNSKGETVKAVKGVSGEMEASETAINSTRDAMTVSSEISDGILQSEAEKNQVLLSSVVKNTTSLSKILENKIQGVLEEIRAFVARILGWVSGTSESEKAARDEAIRQKEEELIEAQHTRANSESTLAVLEEKRDTELKETGKANPETEAFIASAKQTIANQKLTEAGLSKVIKIIGTLEGAPLLDKYFEAVGQGGGSKSTPEFITQGLRKLVQSGEIQNAARSSGMKINGRTVDEELAARQKAAEGSTVKNLQAMLDSEASAYGPGAMMPPEVVQKLAKMAEDISRLRTDPETKKKDAENTRERVISEFNSFLGDKMGAGAERKPVDQQAALDRGTGHIYGSYGQMQGSGALQSFADVAGFLGKGMGATGLLGDKSAGLQGGIANAPKLMSEALDVNNKQLQEFKKKRKDDAKVEKDGPTKYAEAEDKKARERAKEELAARLVGQGMKKEDAMKLAGYFLGQEDLLPVKIAALKGQKLASGKTAGEFLEGQPVAHDFLVHMDSRGRAIKSMRIDSGDTVVGTKPGGAMANAASKAGRGGGGGRIVNNHFYNDGPGIFNSIRKYEDANGIN